MDWLNLKSQRAETYLSELKRPSRGGDGGRAGPSTIHT